MTWSVTLAVVAAMAGSYLLVLRQRPSTLPRWPLLRTCAWVIGVLLVGAGLSPTLNEAAQADHRIHMLQHLLLGMYAPLGLVMGAPVSLLLGTLQQQAAAGVVGILRNPFFQVISHPIPAAVLNVGAMFLLYLTGLYQAALDNPWLQGLVLTHFVLAGYLYAWSIAGRDPSPGRATFGMRVGVLIIAAGAHAYLAKLLYAQADGHAGHGSSSEMQAAAEWMYYGGDGAELLLAVMLFSQWYGRRR